MMSKKAFTLLEVIVALAFLSIGILSMFWMNTASNKSSMDSYYSFLAFSLAREPIEIYRGLTYDTVKKIKDGTIPAPTRYPVAKVDVDVGAMTQMQYPFEAQNFQREIILTDRVTGSTKAIQITVVVSVKGQSRVESWMRKDKVILDSLIVEQPKTVVAELP